MKRTKAESRLSADKDCGVWLDTVQLKQKTQKKRLARPISKMLNPSAGGGGYSLAVALNFTQTKMEMPKTKQSSISAFFTAHRRVLNKMAMSGDSSLGSVEHFSAAIPPLSSGRRRGHENCGEKSDLFLAESDVDQEWKSAIESQIHVTTHSPPPDICYEFEGELNECEPPQSKKRTVDCLLVIDSQPPPEEYCQDPLLTFSHFTASESDEKSATRQNLNSMKIETFENLMDVAGKSKFLNNFPGTDAAKENSSPSKSPRKHLLIPDYKWRQQSPVLSQNPLRRKFENVEKSDLYSKRIKAKSPMKKGAAQPQNAEDENSLAALFTQDSQGFRVIAHRGMQARSPLRDQSNVRNVMTPQSVVEDEDDDDEMLFTQDSQGNRVIRH